MYNNGVIEYISIKNCISSKSKTPERLSLYRGLSTFYLNAAKHSCLARDKIKMTVLGKDKTFHASFRNINNPGHRPQENKNFFLLYLLSWHHPIPIFFTFSSVGEKKKKAKQKPQYLTNFVWLIFLLESTHVLPNYSVLCQLISSNASNGINFVRQNREELKSRNCRGEKKDNF